MATNKRALAIDQRLCEKLSSVLGQAATLRCTIRYSDLAKVVFGVEDWNHSIHDNYLHEASKTDVRKGLPIRSSIVVYKPNYSWYRKGGPAEIKEVKPITSLSIYQHLKKTSSALRKYKGLERNGRQGEAIRLFNTCVIEEQVAVFDYYSGWQVNSNPSPSMSTLPPRPEN